MKSNQIQTIKNLITDKLLFILILFNVSVLFGQQNIFKYEYKFISDSTNQNLTSEIMILNANKEKSEYYSYDKMILDSIKLSDKKKGIFKSYDEKENIISERIIKHFNSHKLDFITTIGITRYVVDDDRKLIWKLEPEFKEILNLKAQKATTEFAGRKWIAWFSSSIPIQDGPYKFYGLPGLILKIEDSKNQHSFELKGIQNSQEPFFYPDDILAKTKINYAQYVKQYKKFRKNPGFDLVGKIPDQRDKDGNLKTGKQILLEFDRKEIERLKKDNNIIEIDLLEK